MKLQATLRVHYKGDASVVRVAAEYEGVAGESLWTKSVELSAANAWSASW